MFHVEQPDDTEREFTPEELEAMAGKMLVKAYKLRSERGNHDDAHQMRHIYGALNVGNTDDEEPDECKLDAIDDYFHMEGWPQVDRDPLAPLEDDMY